MKGRACRRPSTMALSAVAAVMFFAVVATQAAALTSTRRAGRTAPLQSEAVMELFDAMTFLRHSKRVLFSSAADRTSHAGLDLEEQLGDQERQNELLPSTNYEIALQDALFEFFTKHPEPQALEAFQSPEIWRTQYRRDFLDTPLAMKIFTGKRAHMDCLPPMGAYSEAVETFYMYSQGKPFITPADVRSAYKDSFEMGISSNKALAMVKAMQFNDRQGEQSVTATKCEFVRSYLIQRQYLPPDLVSNFQVQFAGNSWWDVFKIRSSIRGSFSDDWAQFLNGVFLLDRQKGSEPMSKCETLLLIASCRMHLNEHFLRFVPQDPIKLKIRDGHHEVTRSEWELYLNHNLMPQTASEATKKESHIDKLLLILFAAHDLNADGLISRIDFGNMMKTMDTWQELSHWQAYTNMQDRASRSIDTNLDPLRVDVMDVKLLKRLPLALHRDPERIARISAIWDSIKDPNIQKLTVKKIAKMLIATGMVSPADAAEEADRFRARYAKGDRPGQAQDLHKSQFLQASLLPPELGSIFSLRDLEVANGYLVDEKRSNSITRIVRQGLPVATKFDRMQFTLLAVTIRAFLLLRDPDSLYSGITLEEFKRADQVIPRLARSRDLRGEAQKEAVFRKYTKQGRERMSIAEFMKLFAETGMRNTADGPIKAPIVTLTSFVTVPRLHTRMLMKLEDKVPLEGGWEDVKYQVLRDLDDKTKAEKSEETGSAGKQGETAAKESLQQE